jgi:hypothetical protein
MTLFGGGNQGGKAMKKIKNLLNAEQLALIFNISEFTVKKLAREKELPCIFINRRPLFNLDVIIDLFDNPKIYKKRMETVETVFGIIKSVMGFR